MITPRVLVAGAFGQGNPGDEAILESFVRGLDGCSVTATSSRSGSPPSSTLPCRLIAPDDRLAVASAAMRADLVIVTATVFKTLHPASGRHRLALLANTLALTLAMRARGRPTAMIGVGAGNLPGGSARALARWTAHTSGPIQLRDDESAWILREAGVRRVLPVGADVTWSVMPDLAHPVPDETSKHPRVLFALSHMAGDRLVNSIREAISELLLAGFRVAVQPWQLPQDAPMAAAVADDLGPDVEVWEPPSDLAEAARTTRAKASVLVGLRFHSLVAAGAAGVPFVAIAHEPKLSALACRLGQRSLAPSAGGAELAAACRSVLTRPPPSPAAVHRETQMAEQAIADVRSLAFGRAQRRRTGVTYPTHVGEPPSAPRRNDVPEPALDGTSREGSGRAIWGRCSLGTGATGELDLAWAPVDSTSPTARLDQGSNPTDRAGNRSKLAKSEMWENADGS